MEERICSICKGKFPLTNQIWAKDKSARSGFKASCKICNNNKNKQYRNQNKELMKARRQERIEKARAVKKMGEPSTYGLPRRTCNICNDVYPLSPLFWHRSAKTLGGFRWQCKSCVKKMHSKHYKKNKTKILKQRTANPEKQNQRNREYRARLQGELNQHIIIEKNEELSIPMGTDTTPEINQSLIVWL